MVEGNELYVNMRCSLIQTLAMGHQAFNVISPNPTIISEAVSGIMKGSAGKNFGWDRIVDFLSKFPYPLKRIAAFESQEPSVAAVYQKGYVTIPKDGLHLKHCIRNLVFRFMCIDAHMALLESGIKNCAEGRFEGQEKKWPPISYGSKVRTTQANLDAGNDWTDVGWANRKWNVEGTITLHHDSHGLWYVVKHADGSVGCYDPTELEVLS